MAVTVQVPKLASVYVAGAFFGITRAGAELETIPHSIPVFSDEHGGEAGPAVDFQALPSLYRINLSMTKFEKSILETLEGVVAGGTGGTFAASNIGELFIAGSKYFRVTIVTANSAWIRNFPICLPIFAMGYNLGTKFSEAMVSFQAMRNVSDGVIWNSTGI